MTASAEAPVRPFVRVRTMQLYLVLYLTVSFGSLVLPHLEPVLTISASSP